MERKYLTEKGKRRVCLMGFWSVITGVILFLGANFSSQAEEIGEYDLHAKAAVLLDGDSGRILFGKNEDLILPMASTTKIMTCIITLENGELEDEVVVSAYAASQPKVHLGMRKGEKYVLKDLLYSLMLESHNDSAVAIAEHIGGKMLDLPETEVRTAKESKKAVYAFAELMNDKARELGCENSFFITPNGLDATVELNIDGKKVEKQHSTTAGELGRIMIYCAWQSPKKDAFLEITRQSSCSFTEGTTGRGFQCANHNAFLGMKEGALTGKTGFTNAAGYCYVGALERDGEKYVVVLLACGWPGNKTWKWKDTSKLMDYGLENYEIHEREEYKYRKEELPLVFVECGQPEKLGEKVYIYPEIIADAKGGNTVLLAENEKIEIVCNMKESLSAPVFVGEEIGNIRYLLEGEVLWEEKIVSKNNVFAIDYKWCFEQILTRFLLR